MRTRSTERSHRCSRPDVIVGGIAFGGERNVLVVLKTPSARLGYEMRRSPLQGRHLNGISLWMSVFEAITPLRVYVRTTVAPTTRAITSATTIRTLRKLTA